MALTNNYLAYFGFPDSYYSVINSATTVKFVSASGNNSNNGNTAGSAYLTLAQALSSVSAVTTSVTIVVLPGSYDLAAASVGSAAVCINDGNYPRVIVCSPGQVTLNCTDATGARDFPPIQFQNANSAIYGAIIKRNAGSRSAAYSVAFLNNSTASFKGNVYNCVWQEVGTNNAWSIQYDNSSVSTAKLYNCTFYNGATPQPDYSGGAGTVITDTVFNTALSSTAATLTSCQTSQTVNPTTYVTTGVTLDGVYSGTYAWNATTTTPNSGIVASGGTVEITTLGCVAVKTHTFTSTGSFVVSNAGDANVEILYIGGGGGGTYNNYVGAGGGGAQVSYSSNAVTATTYTVTVGGGGAAKSTASYGGGANGTVSSISGGSISLSALGGPGSGMNGNPDATGTYTYGVGLDFVGAGGGGAGGAGNVGNGGAGKLITTGIFFNNSTYYGGGGAGGLAAAGVPIIYGGIGGGANTTLAAGGQLAGTNSGGGGGGGSATVGKPASSGADGKVVFAYYVPLAAAVGITLSSNTLISGNSLTATLVSNTVTSGNVAYTITGNTGLISTASSGNFSVTGNIGNIVISALSSLTVSGTITITAEGFSASANVIPDVTITTATMSVSNISANSSLLGFVNGQMNVQSNAVTSNTQTGISTIMLPTSSLDNSMIQLYQTASGNTSTGIVKPFGEPPQKETWL